MTLMGELGGWRFRQIAYGAVPTAILMSIRPAASNSKKNTPGGIAARLSIRLNWTVEDFGAARTIVRP